VYDIDWTTNYALEVECKCAGGQGPILRCYALEEGEEKAEEEEKEEEKMKTEEGGEAFFKILSAIRAQFDTEPPQIVDFCGLLGKQDEHGPHLH
jgi:hypothetical protein